MTKIILSADSTCDLGDELKAKYQVHYYPFHIIFGFLILKVSCKQACVDFWLVTLGIIT